MSLLIVTGLSGSGKSHIVNYFEDLGFFCVDNMPPELIIKFAQMLHNSFGKTKKAVVICDIRSGSMFSKFEDALKNLEANDFHYNLLYLEASESVLVNRYKETRRKHPLANNGILGGIRKEKRILEKIRSLADTIIDTSNITIKQLSNYIELLYNNKCQPSILINLITFGFKYGIPTDADLIFDVRFLPNPFYVENLRNLDGKDKEVSDYVFGFEDTNLFLDMLKKMMSFLLPRYEKEGRGQLVLAIGCTGGQHRSVSVAENFFNFLNENNYKTIILHRDKSKKINPKKN